MNRLVFLESNSLRENPLWQPLVLDIEEWNNVFMTITWDNWAQEKKRIEDFLELTEYERKQVLEKRNKGYLLLWAKQKWWLYPEYFRFFHDENIELFPWSQEELLEVTWKKELIFVKFNFWIGISPEILKPVGTFSDFIKWILQL